MKNKEIQEGQTYMFVATEDVNRKHLEGQPFFVWMSSRSKKRTRRGKPLRSQFYNSNSEMAIAEELQPLAEIFPRCIKCYKRPEDIPEYAEDAAAREMSPDDYVKDEEGTYNAANGQFLCNDCYIKAGMPTTPGGWVAP